MARSRSKSYSSYKNYGSDQAQRHIEEARLLSKRLGGMDNEVKNFFFSMPPEKLSALLQEYGARYNDPNNTPEGKPNAQQYAHQTYHKWKSGKVRMSGLVAGRLFEFLPPHMPLDLKLRIVEGVHENSGPTRLDHVLVPIDLAPKEVTQFIEKSFFSELDVNIIDDELKERFSWLAGDDTRVAEQLLGHATRLSLEMKKKAFEAIMHQLDVETQKHSDVIMGSSSTLQIRQQEIKIKRSKWVEVIQTVSPHEFQTGKKPPQKTHNPLPLKESGDFGWIWWVVIVVGFLWFVGSFG